MATQTLEFPVKRRSWYDLAYTDGASSLSVYVYDEVGVFGITAKAFIEDVSSVSDVSNLDIHINSPGGDVFQGLAIYNFLKRHKASKTVYVDGMAGSIASIIAMAGDRVVMPENAFMFVHNPWTMTAGNADDLRQEAAALEKMERALINVYVSKTGLGEDRVIELMDDETWLTAQEAVDLGFADEVTGEVKMAAKYDPALYTTIPVNIAMQLKGDDMSEHAEHTNEQLDEAAPDHVAPVVEEQPAEEVAEVEIEQPEVEPEVEAVAEQQQDVRAEFKQFVSEFGADRGSVYFAEGLSFDDARVQYLGELKQENEALRARLGQSDKVEPVAQTPDDKSDSPVAFTRDQIAKMSKADYAKHKDAIHMAMLAGMIK